MATHSPTLLLGPDDHGRAVSAEEFAAAEFVEPWGYEREGGRLVVMPPDGHGHQAATEPWRDHLVWYKRERPDLVRHVFSKPWIRVDEEKDRIGDIGVYLAPPRPVAPGAEPLPDLLFEIVSPGKISRERDFVTKRSLYHRLGVREYVIVDRFDRRVTVLTWAPGGYDERILSPADTYTTPLLPGLVIPLAEVL